MGLAVFAAALIGVYARFESSLASLWPANAVMVGMLLRVPLSARPLGWLAGIIGLVAADRLTGASWLAALLLTFANLLGVATIYLIYRRLPKAVRQIRAPMSMLLLGLSCVAGAFMAALGGALAHPLLFDGDPLQGWVFWQVTESVNYISLLPVLLSAPPLQRMRALLRRNAVFAEFRRHPGPLLGLLISAAATYLIGGPGAIAFSVPALLWAGMRYSVFPTAVLTLLNTVWLVTLISLVSHYSEAQVISLRIGVALITLAPLMLACVMHNYNEVLATLKQMADFDGLTAAQTRAHFFEQATQRLQQKGAVGVLMIDLDHFKQINDTYGHAAGDQVLTSAAARIRHCLRSQDLLGRIGGEEFAVLIAGVSEAELLAVAERIREAVAATAIALEEQSISVTTSIGVSLRQPDEKLSLQTLLASADKALYEAKRQGRNRVVLSAKGKAPRLDTSTEH